MVFPTILLGTLMACTLACIFHFWRGGGFKWLVFDTLLAIAGFWLGHLIADLAKWKLLMLGSLNLGGALIGALLLMIGGYRLSMASVDQDQKN